MMPDNKEPEIDDYSFIGSSLGNAYFSNVSFEQLWSCVSLSTNREELDASIAATVRLIELEGETKNE